MDAARARDIPAVPGLPLSLRGSPAQLLTLLVALASTALGLGGCSGAELEAGEPAALEPDASAPMDGAPSADGAGPVSGDSGVTPADAALTADAGDASVPKPAPWGPFATGLAARATGLAGAAPADVVVVYGGYGASTAHVQSLADALFSAAFAARRAGWLVAVKGPDDPRYVNRSDIANSALAAELTGRGSGKLYGSITLVAHSSGAYVAEELLAGLAPTPGALARVRYYNLDGGTRDLAPHRAALGALRFVYAQDGTRLSRNAGAMQSAASAAGLTPFVVDATGSGCASADCLHDAVVIARPWSATTFDVARDYTQFSPSRPVVTSYLLP